MAHQQPYPQPGFNIPPPQYSNPPNVIVAAQLGESPTRMVCPNCHKDIITSTSTECTLPQHAAFFIMCITGVCLICSCLPYCISSLSNVRHECPHCRMHIGTYKRFS